MKIVCLRWDAQNIDHISRHGMTPDELDELLEGPLRIVRSHSSRYALYGRSLAGRYVFAAIEVQGHGFARVITARDMTPSERKRFLHLL